MNEELGINAVAPLGRVYVVCMSLPRAVPTADGGCPFRVLVSAKQERGNERGLGC
jgi:hypothetical protein